MNEKGTSAIKPANEGTVMRGTSVFNCEISFRFVGNYLRSSLLDMRCATSGSQRSRKFSLKTARKLPMCVHRSFYRMR